jgi:hypothetical protein
MSGTKESGPIKAINRQFSEVTRYKDDPSSVWHYFLKEVNGDYGKCKQGNCTKLIKAAGGTTTGIREHLKQIHQIDIVSINQSNNSGNLFL